MQLKDGTIPAYIIGYDAWYADTHPKADPYITIQSRDRHGCGVDWEFEVIDRRFALKVEVFSDAFDAFAEVPELFKVLTSLGHDATLDSIVTVLDTLGFTDVTERTNPYE